MSAEDPLPYRSGAWLKSQGWRIVKLSPWADDDSDSWPSEYVYTITDEL